MSITAPNMVEKMTVTPLYVVGPGLLSEAPKVVVYEILVLEVLARVRIRVRLGLGLG